MFSITFIIKAQWYKGLINNAAKISLIVNLSPYLGWLAACSLAKVGEVISWIFWIEEFGGYWIWT